ncbi:MAG: cytochrome C [Gemmatimonadetes bacterium]|nr:MAG: cytochrome C [Gemmatimonadota bacterium]
MQPPCCALQPPESRCGCTTSRVAAPSYVELGSCSPVRIQLMHSRRPFRFLGSVIVAVAATLCAPRSRAQVPPRPAQATPAGRDGERAPDYPVRPPAPPEQVAHGQQVFQSNCGFCHGSDGRGGEAGPNLVRDEVVLRDHNGELITPIVQNGIPAQGMPKFGLSGAEITDIAAWLHNQPLSDRGAPSTLDILVGDAKHGEAYFNGAGRCTQCHSATGDLTGIGSRYEPKTIQNLIVSGGGGRGRRRSAGAAPPVKPPPTTVTVTLPSGRRVQGELDHLSAFVVALRDSAGTYHSFARHDSIPKVVVTNPLQWHMDMLPKWRDADIHDLTAYLVTLK